MKQLFHIIYKRKKEETQVRFDDKCKTAEKIGLLTSFTNTAGETIDLPSEIIEVYSYRNAIHLIAEQRKSIKYELELSKWADKRICPPISSIRKLSGV